jgi:prevent-host-death family protein
MKKVVKSSIRKKKRPQSPSGTMAGFLERSRQYHPDAEVEFDPPLYMTSGTKRLNNPRRNIDPRSKPERTGATWKLQDAKAQFSELVRRARSGEPQQVTVHGKPAVVVVDPERFEFRPRPPKEATLAGFVERSKKYRGLGLKVPRRVKMDFLNEPNPFEEEGP